MHYVLCIVRRNGQNDVHSVLKREMNRVQVSVWCIEYVYAYTMKRSNDAVDFLNRGNYA